ncbi:MAG: hypothetical protein KDK70_12955, partial [Myxococcales bacterium]|nr:hypothetical protein [Myxococcales bacterium]
MGRAHACAWGREGTAVCWGNDRFGEILGSTRSGHCRPLEVPALGKVTSVAAADHYTCAIDRDGAITCLGAHPSRRVDERVEPRATLHVDGGAVELALAPRHACARTTQGEAWCWGEGLVAEAGGEGPTAQPRR